MGIREWQKVEKCPACGTGNSSGKQYLVGGQYRFGSEDILFPRDGIPLFTCSVCGLEYKGIIPTPGFLTKVIERQVSNVWNHQYHYLTEKDFVSRYACKDAFDLLDIGPSTGGLLNAFKDVEGRRSGLDVVRNPGLSENLRGEFIEGLIDDTQLMWSGEPYDVVTAFDVLEHLYNPPSAFENIRNLVKPGGCFIVETGDSSSAWPKKYGVNSWWYAKLFEHHLFWNEKSLNAITKLYGFTPQVVIKKRHKGRVVTPFWKSTLVLLFHLVRNIRPIRSLIYRITGIDPQMVGNPWQKDHILAVFRREY